MWVTKSSKGLRGTLRAAMPLEKKNQYAPINKKIINKERFGKQHDVESGRAFCPISDEERNPERTLLQYGTFIAIQMTIIKKKEFKMFQFWPSQKNGETNANIAIQQIWR